MAVKQKRKYEIYTQEFKNNPYAMYAEMRENEPLFQQPGLDGETLIWFATSYELVDAILRDTRFVRDMRLAYTDEEWAAIPKGPPMYEMINNNMLAKDGEDHRRLRALVSKAFTPKIIKGMRGRIEEIAHELVDEIYEQGETDLIESFAYLLPMTVIAELLDIPVTDRNKFREWSNALIAPAKDEAEQERMVVSVMEFINYLNLLYDERQANPKDDLISGLMQAEEEGDRLSRDELFSMLALLIVAGHETTVGLIGQGVLALLQDDDLATRLKQNPEDIPLAVEEFLRTDGPAERVLTRWVSEDMELGGKQLRRKDIIVAVASAANRDPAVFENPDEIELDRPHNKHMGFGKGIHFCLGAPLARLEGEIAFKTLLDRLPNLRLNTAVEEIMFRLNPSFRSLAALPVAWDVDG